MRACETEAADPDATAIAAPSAVEGSCTWHEKIKHAECNNNWNSKMNWNISKRPQMKRLEWFSLSPKCRLTTKSYDTTHLHDQARRKRICLRKSTSGLTERKWDNSCTLRIGMSVANVFWKIACLRNWSSRSRHTRDSCWLSSRR